MRWGGGGGGGRGEGGLSGEGRNTNLSKIGLFGAVVRFIPTFH